MCVTLSCAPSQSTLTTGRHATRHGKQKRPNHGPISQSERDWAYVKSSLASGADPDELIVQLVHSRAADKSDPQYYARLTVTKALADLGMPPMQSGSSSLTNGERETQH